MCGIFGFAGKYPLSKLTSGLRRLEYRGYDSWGVAIATNNQMQMYKEVGGIPDAEVIQTGAMPSLIKLQNKNSRDNLFGIAHTRWATHGGVTRVNAHPHCSTNGSFGIVHNGIVENFQKLRQKLVEEGYSFSSETDTEVISRLIESKLEEGVNFTLSKLVQAVVTAFAELEGRNTISVISPEGIIAIRNGSPLVVGKVNDVEEEQYFIGSDYFSFANYTNKVLGLDDYQGVIITSKADSSLQLELSRFLVDLESATYRLIDADFRAVNVSITELDKKDYADFMLKEIHEQPDTIKQATAYTYEELKPLLQEIKRARRVYVVGCGTAAYAAAQIAYYLRRIAAVEAIELKGYEMASYKENFSKDDLMIAISQSGETADTLEAVEVFQAQGGKIASVVNMFASKLTNISDFPYHSRTGPEICVASTKAFTAQISWGFLLAQALVDKYQEAIGVIKQTNLLLKQTLQSSSLQKNLEEVVQYSKDLEHFFVLGRAENYQIALEAALKVKEISYKHFEGFAAGELKHGVLALIEAGTPVFAIVPEDETKSDMLAAVSEVKARGAKVIAIAAENNELFDFYIQVSYLQALSAVINIIPFQLLAHSLGKSLGRDVDKPRNLAKSVTVK